MDNEVPPLRPVIGDLLNSNDLRRRPHTLRVLFSRVFISAAVGGAVMRRTWHSKPYEQRKALSRYPRIHSEEKNACARDLTLCSVSCAARLYVLWANFCCAISQAHGDLNTR
jgi:hypothetical protein